MEYTKFKETIEMLEGLAKKTDSILVGYSGGKDSIVCVDLCNRIFKRVVGFFMSFLPGGLTHDKIMLDYARQKWGIEIVEYPHWLWTSYLKNHIFCSLPTKFTDQIPEIKVHDLYRIIMHDTKINYLVTGAKYNDSVWRRRYFKSVQDERFIFPLKTWKKFDVVAYLKMRKLPFPEQIFGKIGNGVSTGVSLGTEPILWIHDNFPDDWSRLLKYFPYAEAVVYRRKYYGERRRKKL